ncbi:MAG: hypothetical protein LBG52_01795 [Candidatus Peribacteria bacterium]|jgi:hypothetical protein|nr:hypothetical protein [Candidatus Peribacteria bacterium]
MGDKIIGSIAYDEGLFTYEYHKIAETLHSTIHHLYQGIQAYKGFSLDERMRKLYEIKGL